MGVDADAEPCMQALVADLVTRLLQGVGEDGAAHLRPLAGLVRMVCRRL